jgi:hypothetical protein
LAALNNDVETNCVGEWRGAWRNDNATGDVLLKMISSVPGDSSLIRSELSLSNSREFPKPMGRDFQANLEQLRIDAVSNTTGWIISGDLKFEDDYQVLEGTVYVRPPNSPPSDLGSEVKIRLRRQ